LLTQIEKPKKLTKGQEKMAYWFDNTRLRSLAKCDFNYMMRHIFGYVPITEYEPFTVGRAYHTLWESALKNDCSACGRYNNNRCEDRKSTTAEKRCAFFEPGLDYTYAKPENAPYNVHRVFDHWYEKEKPTDEILTVETPWHVRLADGFDYYAKIDLVCASKKGPYPIDHKTTGVLNPTFWEQFEHSTQLIGYCVATGSKTAKINACRKVQLRYDKSRRCVKHKVMYFECTEKHIETETHRFDYTEQQLSTWKQNAIELAEHGAGLHWKYNSWGNDIHNWVSDAKNWLSLDRHKNTFACPCVYAGFCWRGDGLDKFKIEKWDCRGI